MLGFVNIRIYTYAAVNQANLTNSKVMPKRIFHSSVKYTGNIQHSRENELIYRMKNFKFQILCKIFAKTKITKYKYSYGIAEEQM